MRLGILSPALPIGTMLCEFSISRKEILCLPSIKTYGYQCSSSLLEDSGKNSAFRLQDLLHLLVKISSLVKRCMMIFEVINNSILHSMYYVWTTNWIYRTIFWSILAIQDLEARANRLENFGYWISSKYHDVRKLALPRPITELATITIWVTYFIFNNFLIIFVDAI